jgi:hypothetical protein
MRRKIEYIPILAEIYKLSLKNGVFYLGLSMLLLPVYLLLITGMKLQHHSYRGTVNIKYRGHRNNNSGLIL